MSTVDTGAWVHVENGRGRDRCSAVARIIFDRLHERGEIV